ncbi:uncharacterized protein LOC121589752 [Anopheles merus]|uniref:uncharacterized protein LOC121589752 n=1 Tax=Anopheles merus TaxID=30066 RepID=UPI001BE43162|nr:uncharacterized protein LOC121589752 [Anopheles merus]
MLNHVMKQLAPTSDDERSRQRVNGVQKQELVRLMKANFLFIERKHAVVRGDLSRAEVWRMITNRLNSLGPPMHSTEVWQKRWNDLRSTTKQKMHKIQSFVGENGEELCPYRLTSLERQIWSTLCANPAKQIETLRFILHLLQSV